MFSLIMAGPARARGAGRFDWLSVTMLITATCGGCALSDWDHPTETEAAIEAVVRPQVVTGTGLMIIGKRLADYWEKHQRVPASLEELPPDEQLGSLTNDYWGRGFCWESDGQTKVRVWSLGRDGMVGGTGLDADREIVFDGSKQQPSA